MRISQSDNWISNELSWSVPGNFSASIYIENLCTISGALLTEGSLSGGIYRRVFQQDQGIWSSATSDFAMDAPLNRKRILILDQATSLKG
jgi:hypothetical protein